MTLEEEVRQILASGDASRAATRVIHELGPMILRYQRAVLRDEDAAADAFSHFAENVWKGLPGFRGESSLRTWAFRIAWTAARNLQDEAWNRRGRRFATGEASMLAETLRTKTVVRVERQHDALARLRESLSPEDQSLLALRIDQGFSWAEIARILADGGEVVQPLTLMKRFQRLKDRLADLAKQQGLME